MIKKLVYVAVLMLGSLYAMEKQQAISDEQIARLFLQMGKEGFLLQQSTGQQQDKADTDIARVQKRRGSAGEQPLGSQEELLQEELPMKEDEPKAHVLKWLQQYHSSEFDGDRLTILADEMIRRLRAKRESNSSKTSIGPGAGCWGGNVLEFHEKNVRLPGDRTKPPFFPSEH